MNCTLILRFGTILLLACIFAGCTQESSPDVKQAPSPTVSPVVSPARDLPLSSESQTPESVMKPTLPVTPLPLTDPYPGPVSLPHKNLQVSVDVVKDPIYKIITATFTGGKGQKLVKAVEVRTITPDGEITSKDLTNRVGDEVLFQGTAGNDRVAVLVSYLSGDVYKIYDETLSGSRIGQITPIITVTPEIQETIQTPSPLLIPDGPVTLPPDNLSVLIDVRKDPIFNVITITFLGGHGQGIIGTIPVHAVLSDGTMVSEELDSRIGAITEIQGTKGPDRVVVGVVFKSGDRYKIFDEQVSGRR
ncbi:MAG: hypothetical protein JXA44_09875 [Methanospirillaceae archaeon]|nr:hypothetical protein [Methanospirillaceae archaeon]